ncbi:Na+/H+ antiporter NhaC family protein [Paenibacillus sp.]|uniref:Na+/H+ antiporter NhaC family protein n=1 Tax=Paenibacillus sp. TaxID=58172 RepID=UPI002D255F1E|nr:Na+/H+ antiporter NhaC family protein [Paenibacillus sp.]HZG88203.1 Na+/H+ antiporter NhaC family protein [Paenibacillus sp.]
MKMSQFIVVVAVTVAGLAVAYVRELPLAAGFTAGLTALVAMALRTGAAPNARALWGMMREGVAHTKEVVWILLLVGLLIPAWSAGGVIPFLVDAGLRLLHPEWIVTFGFAFASAVAMTLGTSTGTLSAAGIPLMGIAAHLGVPLPLMAGALVSGAFVGDRTSPLSSAHQLVAASAGVPPRSLYRLLQPTTYAAFALALAVFAAFDWFGAWGEAGEGASAGAELAAIGGYTSSWLLALPPLLLLAAIVLRIRTRYAFLIGIASGIAVGAATQGGAAGEWLGWLWAGYPTMSAEGELVRGKGVASMFELVLLIAMAGAYNGILEKTGIVRPIAARLIGDNPTLPGVTIRAGAFGLGLGLVSCTQTLPIMMTARSLAPAWTERFTREQLARVTADTSLLLAALVPWNMIAVLCGTIVGVAPERFAPYALFLWLPPLLTLGYSALTRRATAGQIFDRKPVDTHLES